MTSRNEPWGIFNTKDGNGTSTADARGEPSRTGRGLTQISETFLNTNFFFIWQVLANTLFAFSEPTADQPLRSRLSFQSNRKLTPHSATDQKLGSLPIPHSAFRTPPCPP